MESIKADNIPGGGSPPSWCDSIVESHLVNCGGPNRFYIQNTFEGNCSKSGRIGLWMAVVGFGFLPLLIPAVRRGALYQSL